MNFKAPRDPNTKPSIVVLRTIPPGSPEICQVGSGECHEPAIEAHENGEGGEFFVCAKHLPEIHALGKLIAEMTREQLLEFEKIIKSVQ
jgi:hypothetical protein